MPAAARLDDTDNAGGVINGACSGDVVINGKPAALQDSTLTPDYNKRGPHAKPTITAASGTVIVNGKGLAYNGSSLNCGHAINSGSGDVDVAA